MTPFEKMLLEEIARAKRELARDESLSGFTLEITATGRLDSDTEVSFTVADYYGGQPAKAGSLAAALAEFLRRRNWTARHAPLCLPNAGAEVS